MPKKGENFWISLSMKLFKSGNWVPKLGAIMRNIVSGFWRLIFSLLPPDGCKFLEVDVLSLWARSSVSFARIKSSDRRCSGIYIYIYLIDNEKFY